MPALGEGRETTPRGSNVPPLDTCPVARTEACRRACTVCPRVCRPHALTGNAPRPRLFGHSKASVLLWAEACNPACVRAIRFPPRAAARRVSLTGSTRPRALLDRPDRPRGQVRRLAHSTGGPSWGKYVGSLPLGPRGALDREVSKSQHLYSRLYVGLAPLRALIRHEKPITNPNEGIVYLAGLAAGCPGAR